MINSTITLADHVPRCHLVYHRLKLTLSHATQRTLRRALASAAPSASDHGTFMGCLITATSTNAIQRCRCHHCWLCRQSHHSASRTVSARFVASPRYECDVDGFSLLYSIDIFSTHPTATLVYSAAPTTPPRLRLPLHCSCLFQHNLHMYTHRSARELRLPTTSP